MVSAAASPPASSPDRPRSVRIARFFLWNADERRLRAPWRFALAAVLAVVLLAGVTWLARSLLVPNRALLTATVGDATGTLLFRLGTTLLAGGTFVLVVALAGRVLDRRHVSDFGLALDRSWWVDLGFGLALGAGLMTLIFAVELALGWVTVTGTFVATESTFWVQSLSALALFLAVGVYEELLARGYVLTNVAEGLAGLGPIGDRGAVAVAVLLSAAIFGVAHAGNPNATVVSTVAVGVGGVMLAAGYVLTAELSIPIGLHITWNLFQGLVYGFPVSGNPIGAAVVGIDQAGPAIATGGAFGPEAGLLGITAMLVGSVVTVAWVKYRYGHVRVHPDLTTPALRWQ